MTTKLILIRHGETDWSSAKRYCGFTDIDLNENGIKQARSLSKNLDKKNIHKVYSSGMKRSIHFARIVFEHPDIEAIPGLKEMGFGVFEGLRYMEIMERYPEIYKKWLEDPFNTAIPDAESLPFFKNRIEQAISRLVAINEGRTLAVVTHAGPIRIIIAKLMKARSIWDIKPDLASVSIVEFNNGLAEVKLFNDRSYING